jgi:spore coat polysaccharide biosynthesis protein SpsF
MDSWADYQRMLDVFGRVSDPSKATWQELCDHLHIIGPTHGIPQRFSSKGNIAELALGTVQLGLPYGIANTDGQPSFENAKELVQRAIVHGVTHLDCAAAYGAAEARLGQIVNRDYQSQVTIVTKLSPLTQLSETSKDPDIEAHVTASVYKSCIDLNIKQLPYLLLHRWQHRTSNGGRIWEVLKQLQQKGVIKRLGASVQNPEEALQAIDDPEIEFIQLPFNLLDRRFQQSGFSKKAEARKDVVIQARSVFLQGVLISPAQTWPDITNIKAVDIIDQLSALTKKFNRGSISDLCVAYVRSQSWIDCLVVGMENMNQLDQNVALFQNPRLNGSECMEVEEVFSNLPEELLNPALWIRKEETK